jgi:peptidoglycan hydrolase-like protein with peptidoglycan-binding domain
VKQFIFLALALFLIVNLNGCGKKKETLEEIQEPLSIEISPSPASVQEALPGAPAAIEPVTAIPLPPQGPYKPSSQQIQTALKNAGYYAGKVDGKIGPLSKEAIKKFQAANNLNVDGKVGPKTWELLSKHLSEQPAEPSAE